MADYYTLFSSGIYRITPEERAWIERQLDPESWESSPPGWEAPLDDGFVDFDWSFEKRDEWDEDRMGETYLWVRSEERGDPAQVGAFVQAFLGRFRPADHFAMTFAWSCSKPRLDDFAGGAVFVTAHRRRLHDVEDWVTEMRQVHQESPVRSDPTRAAAIGDGDGTRGDAACNAAPADAIAPPHPAGV